MLRKLESTESEQAAVEDGLDDDDSMLIIDEARIPRRPLS